MADKNIDDLKAIRSMMEQSSRFISLSGWSGVFAGIYALIAAGTAYMLFANSGTHYFETTNRTISIDLINQLFAIGIITLVLALTTGILFSVRKSRKNNLQIWNHVTKKLLINLAVPLAMGGIFSFALFLNGSAVLIAPTTLIFYGLALLNAGKYTFPAITYLGYCQLVLGIIGLFFVGKGLLLWAIGFGVLHIIYGFYMQKKYQ